jgi:hypothetical protein
MYFDDSDSNNSEEVCNLFAKFFQETYTTHSEADRDREYFGSYPEFSSDISVNQINVHEILDRLRHLDASKGSGPDGVPPSFMKTLAVELTSPLFWLFNMSLDSGDFPKLR